MVTALPVRNFQKVGDGMPVPNLIGVQTRAYAEFLQAEPAPDDRAVRGLEALLREMFPIESYDGNLALHYINYELGKPRYTPDECRELRLTYGMPSSFWATCPS
jgi:DNA-directed RNA polymerase subunit beta